MKKLFLILSIVLMAAMAVVSCKKQEEPPVPAESGETMKEEGADMMENGTPEEKMDGEMAPSEQEMPMEEKQPEGS